MWKKQKELENCTEEERNEANLRQLYETEVVLDCDKVYLSEVIAALKEEGFFFKAYKHRADKDSGHVHMEFPELADYTKGDRKIIREIIIKRFGCDQQKSSEDTLIAWEGRPHFKTGEIKRLVDEVPGINTLPEWVIGGYHKKKASTMLPIDVDELLEKGPIKGTRNQTVVILATHCRKKGLNHEQALDELRKWNEKNGPDAAYPDRELTATVRGAYDIKTPYSYKFKDDNVVDVNAGRTKKLVDYTLQRCTFFHDQFNNSFALIDSREVCPVHGSEMKRWLSRLFWEMESDALDDSAISSAINILDAMGTYDGQQIELNNRIAQADNKIYYDMTDDGWRVVEISQNGWALVTEHPPLFRRYKHQQPQVEPERGDYSLNDFIDLLNIKEGDDRLLVKSYIVSLFMPGISHPVMIPYGPQGSGKTLMQNMIRKLVDPSSQETLIFPRDKHELAQTLNHHYCAFFDNVSNLNQEMSDMLCRATTGSGYTKRKLYSDDDDITYNYRRAIGLNGINNPATKPDLMDRSILLRLERISKGKRLKEGDIMKRFREIIPSVLADMFDILVKALTIYPSVDLQQNSPRMVDFAAYGEAIARAMGYKEFEFINAYFRNVEIQNIEIIELNPVGAVTLEFMRSRKYWYGTSTELLEQLEAMADRLKIRLYGNLWPKAPHALSRRLNEVRPNLEERGLHYSETRTMMKVLKRLEWDKDAWERISRETENEAKSKNEDEKRGMENYFQ